MNSIPLRPFASIPLRASAMLVALFLCLTSPQSRADQPLHATEAAARLGQKVVMEDVVQAFSHSRTKKGGYLSFGAPYPKQVLSVWVPDEICDQIPHKPGLIGRTVRIRGTVAESPTGPMIRLASPEQFDLLDANAAILAKDFLDGQMDREHFMAAVAQTFWREDFATLDELFTELQQSHERFADGTWIESSFFKAFDVVDNESDERYAEVGHKIDRWRSGNPTSAAAELVQAGYHLNLAWHARVLASAAQKTEVRAEFQREVSVARQLLEAQPGAKVVPDWFVKMEIVAIAQHWTAEEFFQLLREAVTLEPDYYTFYFQAARYLRDCGGKGAWEKFAEAQRQARGAGGEGDVLYTRIAWSMSVNYRNLFQSSSISWKTMAAGFDRLMQQHPQSLWLKNAYAQFAFQARDRARLRPALAAIGDHPDMEIWVNLENVGFARRFAEEDPTSPR